VKGDVLKHNGHNYQINTVEYRTKDKSLTDHFIHYWRISLTGPPITATNPQFEVTESKLEPLLNGQPYNCRVFVNRDPHGHLFYTDGGVNMHFKNVERMAIGAVAVEVPANPRAWQKQPKSPTLKM
jgi:hypothetical protein